MLGAIQNLERSLASNYVPRAELIEMFRAEAEARKSKGERIGRLEGAPHKYLTMILAIVGTGVSVLALLKH